MSTVKMITAKQYQINQNGTRGGVKTEGDTTWVKLFRKFGEWGWYSDPVVKSVFLHFFLYANHKPNNWQGVEVNRGQLIIGLSKCAKTLGISLQSLRTAITKLKSTGEITHKSTNKFTLITVVNYDSYQACDFESTHESTHTLTNEQQTNNKRTTTNKNDNNDKNEKKEDRATTIKIKFAERILLTQDQYDDLIARANKVGQSEAWVKSQIDIASDWTLSKGRVHRDAAAFLRNWCRRALATDRRNGGRRNNAKATVETVKSFLREGGIDG